jgi:hypothetical protein
MKTKFDYLIGKEIRIISMDGEPHYTGKQGIIKSVDGIGQLHGSWGGLAINPSVDNFEVLN